MFDVSNSGGRAGSEADLLKSVGVESVELLQFLTDEDLADLVKDSLCHRFCL